jgi:CheY-like chemotaxis protein
LQHLVREIGKIMRETFPREISTRVEAAPDLWLVRGDATQIHQALMNLCINARDAMPDGGTLVVRAWNETLDAEQAARILDGRVGSYVCVSVSDTGTGIATEHLDHLFLPFFTTKALGKGTGLGLATVRGIVRGHDGFLRLETEIGCGTRFFMYLPASPELEPARGAEVARAPLPDGAGRLVLVVDDEESVRTAVCRALRRAGYRTREAANGADGVAAYAAGRTSIDAVVTDLMMPVMSGSKMVAALWGMDPGVVVIGMTGLTEEPNEAAAVRKSGHFAGMVAKPFAAHDLLESLSRALAARPKRSAPVNEAGGSGMDPEMGRGAG